MVQWDRTQVALTLDHLPDPIETVIEMGSVPVWWEGGCVARRHLEVAGWLFGVVLVVEFSAGGV